MGSCGMKKFIYVMLALSIAGVALSAYLTVEHYYPEIGSALRLCGNDLNSACASLRNSPYSSVFGVPIAGIGLLFYLFILFTVLVADYAGERYYTYAAIIAFPATALALAVDIALAIILVVTGLFCGFCIATYGVTALMFATSILWYRFALRDAPGGLRGTVRQLVNADESGPDRRAAVSLYVIFGFLLLFTVFSFNYILFLKTFTPAAPRAAVDEHLRTFYAAAPERLELPPSALTIGPANARVRIIAFTDFLCSACSHLFEVEKQLFAQFKGSLAVTYYHYPLDTDCNPFAKRTTYPHSCSAARAMSAAAQKGFFPRYLSLHFKYYRKISGGYTADTARALADSIAPDPGFMSLMGSPAVSAIIERDARLAEKLGISATPTLFINGRRMVGVPPVELLSAIIRREMGGQ